MAREEEEKKEKGRREVFGADITCMLIRQRCYLATECMAGQALAWQPTGIESRIFSAAIATVADVSLGWVCAKEWS